MGKTAVKERRTETRSSARMQAQCIHHWLIESPRGALSKGRCKLCGLERDFRNSSNDYIWDDDSSSGSGLGSLGGVKSSSRPRLDDEDGMAASGSGSSQAAMAV